MMEDPNPTLRIVATVILILATLAFSAVAVHP